MIRDELVEFWATTDVRVELKKTLMMGVVGLILAFIAPYDTSDMPGGIWRVMYWVSLLLFGSVLSGPVGRYGFPKLEPHIKSPAVFLLAYATLLSVPVYFAVIFCDIFFHSWAYTGQNPDINYAIAFLTHEELTLLDLLIWFGQVVLITFMALGAISLVNHATRPKPPGKAETESGPPPGYLFLRRLPPALGQDLLCLQMEDHYARAYTAKGDTLVRMRLKDAVAELEGFGGLRVHRSWWVALSAVETVRKEGRRHVIYLKGGLQVPVSKTYEDALKGAGYLG